MKVSQNTLPNEFGKKFFNTQADRLIGMWMQAKGQGTPALHQRNPSPNRLNFQTTVLRPLRQFLAKRRNMSKRYLAGEGSWPHICLPSLSLIKRYTAWHRLVISVTDSIAGQVHIIYTLECFLDDCPCNRLICPPCLCQSSLGKALGNSLVLCESYRGGNGGYSKDL